MTLLWILILVVVLICLGWLVLMWGSDTGNDQEGYTVADDPDDSPFDANLK